MLYFVYQQLENETIETEEPRVEAHEDTGLKKQTFVREMIEAGYSETLAWKALEELQPDQIDEGMFNQCVTLRLRLIA